MEIIRFPEHDDIAINDNDREDQEPERRRNMKKKSVNDTPLVRRQLMELVLHVRGGEGIDVDEDKDGTAAIRRRYCACVAYWMEPEKGHYSRKVQATWNNVGWDQVYCIPVIDYIPGNYGFLCVEVARLYSETDPGTSSGTVIVGRAKVPLPREPYKAVEGWFELVRPTGDGHMCFAGSIILRMELRGRYI